MAGVIAHLETILNQFLDAGKCPQLGRIPRRQGAFQEQALQLAPLCGRQPGFPPRRPTPRQARFPLPPPRLMPAVGAARAYPEPPRHLGLRDPCCEEPRRFQPPLFKSGRVPALLAAVGCHTYSITTREAIPPPLNQETL
jgi:hypothetical protein